MPLFTVLRGFTVCMLVTPILMVLGAWLQWDAVSADIWQGLLETVLPEYTLTSLLLCLLVAIGVVSMGSVGAAAVSLFDFPGRQTLSWLLLLPLAMPAYVVAYAYTDFLQYSGPLQSWLRLHMGWQGALWPDVRSTWGAAVVLSLSLYPYVYLLCRSALAERAPQLMEAARLLGAGLTRRIFRVALPLARPAIAAGLALAMMETLADFGVSSYFGVQTFSTGIYKAWLVMDNRVAAAQLSSFLLLLVAMVLWLEYRAQSRLRFVTRRGASRTNESQALRLYGWRAALAIVLCVLPVLLGFVFPLLIMGHALWVGSQQQALPWGAFVGWFWNSLKLGGISAVLAVGLALACVTAFAAALAILRQRTARLGPLLALTGAALMLGLYPALARLPVIWPGEQAFQAAMASAASQSCPSTTVSGWGYAEPSLVWQAGAETQMFSAKEHLPASIAAAPCAFVLRAVVQDQAPAPASCQTVATVSGFALGAGRWITLDVLSCGKSK